MSRFTINKDTLDITDTASISSETLQQHLGNNILIDLTTLKEQCLGKWSKSFSNRLFIEHSRYPLKTIRISNKTYVINDFIYDPTLVRFLGSKAADKDKIPERLLEALKYER